MHICWRIFPISPTPLPLLHLLGFQLQFRPQLVCPDSHGIMENKTVYQISCKIRGYPPVRETDIKWRLIGPELTPALQRRLIVSNLFEDFGETKGFGGKRGCCRYSMTNTISPIISRRKRGSCVTFCEQIAGSSPKFKELYVGSGSQKSGGQYGQEHPSPNPGQ